MRAFNAVGLLVLPLLLGGCAEESVPAPSAALNNSLTATSTSTATPAGIAFERFTLANGLDVVFHIDRSDPVVAVVLTAHVGSAREVPGRTGFAHLFEHLLFLESENLGKGGLDALSARIGGSGANGSTSRDRTNYLQTVPSDALEKMLWAEADKLGWFINTVTEPVLAKEKQVVKNEKRQSYDNQPYGHTMEVVTAALYPAGHPYSWDVIGSLDDIQSATLDDVREFYRRWYVPNNVTLSVAGDFDTAAAREWVEKYFGEIARGPDAAALAPPPVKLTNTQRYVHEDNYAQLPELTLVWPTVPRHHPDAAALDVLAGLLSEGKRAPLNAVLIDEQQLTDSVDLASEGSELAGEWWLSVRAFDGTDLDSVQAALDTALLRFEAEGIADDELTRIKTAREVDYFSRVATVLGKAAQLGEAAAIHGDPALVSDDLRALQAVTAADVRRVYETYLKNQPHIATSFVPKGQTELALTGAVQAAIEAEPIVAGAEAEFDASEQARYDRTPSSFDRSIEPPYGVAPVLSTPRITEETLANGLRLHVMADTELPLVRFALSIEGGQLVENAATPGVAHFVAQLFDKGTATRTPAEMEEALAMLGAELSVSVDAERFSVNGLTLARNFDATLALVGEMLLAPRWDDAEIALARARITADLQDSLASPTAIADRLFARVSYGDQVFARDVRGTAAAVAAITKDDLRSYFALLAPALADLRVVGAVQAEQVRNAVLPWVTTWTAVATALPSAPVAEVPSRSTLYFYDMPGAAQSVLRFGHPSVLRTSPDFYSLQILNYRLGGGGFASRLTQELREAKGYTYGINSRFSGTERQGRFLVSSSVRSNVTFEAAELVRRILSDYGGTFTEEDLAVSQSFLLKSQARAFESLDAKLGMLAEIADYDLPHDYVVQQRNTVESMTVARIRELAASYLQPAAMHYVVVGDAATQVPRLRAMGIEIVQVDELAQ